MGVEMWGQLIPSVGFPIALCIYLLIRQDRNDKQSEIWKKEFKEEVEKREGNMRADAATREGRLLDIADAYAKSFDGLRISMEAIRHDIECLPAIRQEVSQIDMKIDNAHRGQT